MSGTRVTFCVFFLCLMSMGEASSASMTQKSADFQSEIKLSCEKYAKEDRIPSEEVEEYVAQCVREFSESQPTDLSTYENEEGIQIGPPGEYFPLAKSMEMEKAHPIDPPPEPKPLVPAAPMAGPVGNPPAVDGQ